LIEFIAVARAYAIFGAKVIKKEFHVLRAFGRNYSGALKWNADDADETDFYQCKSVSALSAFHLNAPE
jgi:hypothetical protein